MTTSPNRHKRILIVEDEGLVAAFLQEALEERGFEVLSPVDNAAAALAYIRAHPIDLVLMDIEIKGPLDGIQTAAEIQKITSVPLIFLTAYKDDDTIFSAIEHKPSAYLIKPVTEEELIAAVALALKKEQVKQPEQPKPYPYRLCPQSGVLYAHDKAVSLSKMERQLAALLFEKPGRIVTQEEILSHCWPDENANGINVRNLLFKLRKKLDLIEIETIKDMGYRVAHHRA